MLPFLKRSFEAFLFTSIYIACCAAGMVYQTFLLFGLSFPLPFLLFVFSGTVCSYNFHWMLSSHEEEELSPKNKWNLRNRKVHGFLAIGALMASVFFLYHLQQHFVWLAAAGVITFLYSAPKMPFEKTAWLRRIAYGKTTFLALAWTYITAMLPLLIVLHDWQQQHYLFCTNRFLLIYAICILFDLRDRDRDRKEGIRSLVTQLEVHMVDRLYWGVLMLYGITTIWLTVHFSLAVIAALLLPGLVIAFFYRWFRMQQSDFIYYFLLDGMMAFSLPLLLIFGI